jgi:hypothetical protein
MGLGEDNVRRGGCLGESLQAQSGVRGYRGRFGRFNNFHLGARSLDQLTPR